MKYVDAEKLIAELTKMQFELNAAYRKPQSDNIVRAISLEYDDILSLVDSPLEEQPDVDLEKEIEKVWEKCNPIDEGMGVESAYIHIEAFDIIARHFYELGLNARKEE
jgi:hypothetical protein